MLQEIFFGIQIEDLLMRSELEDKYFCTAEANMTWLPVCRSFTFMSWVSSQDVTSNCRAKVCLLGGPLSQCVCFSCEILPPSEVLLRSCWNRDV